MTRGLRGNIKETGRLSLSLAEFGKMERRGKESRWSEGRVMITPDQSCAVQNHRELSWAKQEVTGCGGPGKLQHQAQVCWLRRSLSVRWGNEHPDKMHGEGKKAERIYDFPVSRLQQMECYQKNGISTALKLAHGLWATDSVEHDIPTVTQLASKR